MFIKVLSVFWVLVITRGLLWCHEKCICHEDNVKLFCRDVNEKDFFKNSGLTREIELRKSMVGLAWVTETFGKLQRVTFVDSNVLDCNGLYVLRIVGACDEQITHRVNEIKSKGVTSKSVQKWVKKRTFDITVAVLIIGGIIFSVVGIVLVRQRLIKRYLRIREERMAYMMRLGGFDFDQAEEDRENRKHTEEAERVENKGQLEQYARKIFWVILGIYKYMYILFCSLNNIKLNCKVFFSSVINWNNL